MEQMEMHVQGPAGNTPGNLAVVQNIDIFGYILFW